MNNVVLFNEDMASEVFDAMVEKVSADESIKNISSTDTAYALCRKYFDISKSKFVQLLDFCQAIKDDDGCGNRKLTDFELEMVAGGSLFGDALKWVVGKVANFCKDVANTWSHGSTSEKVGIVLAAVGMVPILVGTAIAASPLIANPLGMIALSGFAIKLGFAIHDAYGTDGCFA